MRTLLCVKKLTVHRRITTTTTTTTTVEAPSLHDALLHGLTMEGMGAPSGQRGVDPLIEQHWQVWHEHGRQGRR